MPRQKLKKFKQASPSCPMASLYIGDLHPDVTEAMLFDKFSLAGPVLSIRVFRNKTTQRSLGYANINFQQSSDAEHVLNTMNHDTIKGRPIRIMWYEPDPSNRKSGEGNVLIQNLDQSIDNKALYDTLSAFGNILSCKVMTDETGISKGFGYVNFEDTECAEKAVEELNGKEIDGRPLYAGRAQKKMVNSTNLYVKNLAHAIDDERLRKEFSQFGTITSAKVMTDDDTGRSMGYGFVCFTSPEEATKAVMEMDGRVILSMMIYVGLAQRKEDRKAHLASQYMQRISSFLSRVQAPQQFGQMYKPNSAGYVVPTMPNAQRPFYLPNQVQGMLPSPRWSSNVRQPGQPTPNSIKASGLYVDGGQKKMEHQTELKDSFKCYIDNMSCNQGFNGYVNDLDDSSDDEQLGKEFSQFITSANVGLDDSSDDEQLGKEFSQFITSANVGLDDSSDDEQLGKEFSQFITSANVGLDDSSDDEQLCKEFSQFGTITSANMMTDVDSGRSNSPEEATKRMTKLQVLASDYNQRISRLQSIEDQAPQQPAPRWPSNERQPDQPTAPVQPLKNTSQIRALRPTMGAQSMVSRRVMNSTEPCGPLSTGFTFTTTMASVPGRPTTIRALDPGRPIFTTIPALVPGWLDCLYTTRIRNPAVAQSAMAPFMQQPHQQAVQGQEPLTASMLAQAPLQEQEQMLGDRLFPLIQQMHMDLAGKITGMLLEIDNSELLHMLESKEHLTAKVEEAVAVLQAHQAKEGTVDPAEK